MGAISVNSIKPIRTSPNENIINELERLLADAKAGKVQGIAVAEIMTGSEFAVWFERGETSILSLLGAAEMLKTEIAVGGMEWDYD